MLMSAGMETASEKSSVRMLLNVHRQEQRPDALGRLDEAQDATDAKNTNDAQQRRRHEVLLDDVRQKQTCKNLIHRDVRRS